MFRSFHILNIFRWLCQARECRVSERRGGEPAGAEGALVPLRHDDVTRTRTGAALPLSWLQAQCRLIPPTTTTTNTQCCGSGMFIADPGSEFSPSRIRIFSILEPGSEFFSSRFPDLHQRIYLSRIQGSKRHGIPNPEPQHCHHHLNTVGTKDAKVLCLMNERII